MEGYNNYDNLGDEFIPARTRTRHGIARLSISSDDKGHVMARDMLLQQDQQQVDINNVQADAGNQVSQGNIPAARMDHIEVAVHGIPQEREGIAPGLGLVSGSLMNELVEWLCFKIILGL
ncbi:hypothetical protein QAD02_021735 [Eretmocerus hayati]|uniref:Uncharacterized protein n=1 Tax=Eretmocerus hayati TaxID=131215 RepID=A0ACC2PRA5_9HYME|nr:hypothetical protein QAD02_021735 [Eretmocerus hayati]